MAVSISPSFHQHQLLTAFVFIAIYELFFFPDQSQWKGHLRRSVLNVIDSQAPPLRLPDLANKHTGCPAELKFQMNKVILRVTTLHKKGFFVYFKFKFKWFKYNLVTLHMEGSGGEPRCSSQQPQVSP